MHQVRKYTTFPTKTKKSRTNNIVEFHHAHNTVPNARPEDKVANAISKLKYELVVIPTPSKNGQLDAIQNIYNLLTQHYPKHPSTLQTNFVKDHNCYSKCLVY